MKTFLITSTFLMIAAGIYGAFDLSMDIRNGTLIKYDDGSDIQTAAFFAGRNRHLSGSNTIHIAQKSEEKKKPAPTLINSFADLSISDFSRGEPPIFYDAMLLNDLAQPDSLKNEDVAAAITDTLRAISENKSMAKDTSSVKPKEERKFSLKLYSRGRPRMPTQNSDTALKDSSATK